MFRSSLITCLVIMAINGISFIAFANDVQTVDEKNKEIESEQIEPLVPIKTVMQERLASERESNKNQFSLSQHWSNYVLPASYVSNPNPISFDGVDDEVIDNFEAKYQISIKTPLWLQKDNLSGVYFGFTAVSFWQLYNSETSKPFRETNYEPELFYQFDAEIQVLGYEFNILQVGLNHQSNGQNGLKSRSWNRITVSALFSDENTAYYIRTWYRLPEDDKEYALDPRGDDNPDINDYYGRVELGFNMKLGKVNLSTRLRNNLRFSDNRSGVELSFSYPINDRYDFLIQYFNGYGDSLIDYNRHQQRISAGVQLKFL